MADEAVRRLRAEDLLGHQARVIETFGLGEDVPTVVRVAIRGWLALTITVDLEWLEDRTVDQQAARDVCVAALFSALTSSGALPRATPQG